MKTKLHFVHGHKAEKVPGMPSMQIAQQLRTTLVHSHRPRTYPQMRPDVVGNAGGSGGGGGGSGGGGNRD